MVFEKYIRYTFTTVDVLNICMAMRPPLKNLMNQHHRGLKVSNTLPQKCLTIQRGGVVENVMKKTKDQQKTQRLFKPSVVLNLKNQKRLTSSINAKQ